MNVTLTSTTKIVSLNGHMHRVWEGETESGIKCHAFIARVAIDIDEPRAIEFQQELVECKPPSIEIEAIPFKLIIN